MVNRAARASSSAASPEITAVDAPLWSAVADAVVVTPDRAAAALQSMEVERYRYDDTLEDAAARMSDLAQEMGRPDLFLRARLILADITSRRGSVSEATTELEQIRIDAQRIGSTYALARSHFLLGIVQYSIGDAPSAQIHGIRSVELLPDSAPTPVLIDHLCALGVAYGPGRDCDQCHVRALDLANAIGSTARAILIHNTLGYFAWREDDIETASKHAANMLELSRVRGIPLGAAELDTIARVHMMYGDFDHAIEVLAPVISEENLTSSAATVGSRELDPKPYAAPEGVLTVAEAHRRLGRYEKAQAYLALAQRISEERGLARTITGSLREQAALYAELGEYEKAFDAHRAFHRATTAMYSREQEARANIVQATYDAAEQRRDTLQFRDLAMRDALTGLYNRRFIDSFLDEVSTNPATMGTPLSVAIVDADLFKRINDECSHAVGDAVLRELASILVSATATQGTVARLGGEEFVVVLPGLDAAHAEQCCESVRRAVSEHNWMPLTAGLNLTVSIGVTTSAVGAIAASELLAAADHNLYAAKRSGRNRVMADRVDSE